MPEIVLRDESHHAQALGDALKIAGGPLKEAPAGHLDTGERGLVADEEGVVAPALAQDLGRSPLRDDSLGREQALPAPLGHHEIAAASGHG